MTRIDFHILPDTVCDAIDYYACTLAEEAYKQGRRVLILACDEAHCAKLDKLLWSYRDSSFVPHGPLGGSIPAAVEISHGEDAGAQHQLLINISGSIPPFFGRFEQVCEIVVEDESVKQQTRDHYRYYKGHGYPLHHHQIRQRILSH